MTTEKLEGLSRGHWVCDAYRQRMTTKEWRQVLLEEQDTILFRGNLCQLRAKDLGYGVVEVYKDLPEEKEKG